MSNLNQRLVTVNQVLQQKVGLRQGVRNSLAAIDVKRLQLAAESGVVSKAKALLELFVKSTETAVRDYIEPTVTEALNFIFNQHLYFHIVFVDRRNQIEIDFIVLPTAEKEKEYQSYLLDIENCKDDFDTLVKDYKDLNFLYGGAIQEVLGLVLRVILVELLRIEGPVILDEPTSAVHEEYAQRVGVFIKTLSERFNRQVIYVTHSQALAAAANRVYEVTQHDGISQVKEV